MQNSDSKNTPFPLGLLTSDPMKLRPLTKAAVSCGATWVVNPFSVCKCAYYEGTPKCRGRLKGLSSRPTVPIFCKLCLCGCGPVLATMSIVDGGSFSTLSIFNGGLAPLVLVPKKRRNCGLKGHFFFLLGLPCPKLSSQYKPRCWVTCALIGCRCTWRKLGALCFAPFRLRSGWRSIAWFHSGRWGRCGTLGHHPKNLKEKKSSVISATSRNFSALKRLGGFFLIHRNEYSFAIMIGRIHKHAEERFKRTPGPPQRILNEDLSGG